MKLSELAKEPQLQKIVITDETIVEKYGEELEFYIYDRQPLDIFTKLAAASTENASSYIDLLADIIMDEEGNKVISNNHVLPMDVLTEALKLIGAHLGK